MTSKRREVQKGSVIIMVLWTAVLLTVLVTAMAGKVRLSAKTAVHNSDASKEWSQLMAAMNFAQMELMLERMPAAIGVPLRVSEEGEVLNPFYRYDGESLQLHYGLPENMVVHIYDHAGKINLNGIPRQNMQTLIQERLGGEAADPEEVQTLLDAWTDWTDLNDLQGANGAEKDYYLELDEAYTPRNNPELDTVEEILHIRGFAELFEGVNLEAAFTIYGNVTTVNLNLATREAMQLLPGLNDELIETVIAFRELEDINNPAEIAEIIPFENLQELSPWVGTDNHSDIYSIFAYPKQQLTSHSLTGLAEDDEDKEHNEPEGQIRQAYMEIVEISSANTLPRVFKVDPYGVLPDAARARIEEYDIEF